MRKNVNFNLCRS